MKKLNIIAMFLWTIKIVDYSGGPLITTYVGEFRNQKACNLVKNQFLQEDNKFPQLKWFSCVEK